MGHTPLAYCQHIANLAWSWRITKVAIIRPIGSIIFFETFAEKIIPGTCRPRRFIFEQISFPSIMLDIIFFKHTWKSIDSIEIKHNQSPSLVLNIALNQVFHKENVLSFVNRLTPIQPKTPEHLPWKVLETRLRKIIVHLYWSFVNCSKCSEAAYSPRKDMCLSSAKHSPCSICQPCLDKKTPDTFELGRMP